MNEFNILIYVVDNEFGIEFWVNECLYQNESKWKNIEEVFCRFGCPHYHDLF